MSKYQEAKKRYDEQSISDILKSLDSHNQGYLEAREQFIIGLTYLCTSGRYREHSAYKKSTFEDFLSARYGLNMTTFYQERAAFINYENYVKPYGLGTVRKVLSRVDNQNRHKVFDEMKPNMPLKKQNEVIEQYSRPKPAPKPAVAAQPKSEVDLKKQVVLLQNQLAAKEAQLKKAQAAVVYWKGKYNEIQSMLNPVWQVAELGGEKTASA